MIVEGCTHRTPHHHGTRNAYASCGCRCDDCRDASRVYQRNYRREPVDDMPAALEHFDLRLELPEWHLDAACRGVDPGLFFPDRGNATREAKAVCGSCPVQPECLDWAIANREPSGIWGGMSERERRTERKRRAA